MDHSSHAGHSTSGTPTLDSSSQQELTGAAGVLVGLLAAASASMFALAILVVFGRLGWGKLLSRRRRRGQESKMLAAAASCPEVVLDTTPGADSVGSTTCEISIEGMTCAACSGAVERALSSLDGVLSADVNLLANTARVTFRSPAQAQGLCDAIEEIGFGATLTSTQENKAPAASTKLPATSNQTVALFSIEGMTCAACSGAVERALKATAGVVSAEVNLLSLSARICFRAPATAALLCETVEDIGFGASLLSTEEQKTSAVEEKAPSQTTATFAIEGMTCTACSGGVERALKGVQGVISAEVNLLSNTARVSFVPPATPKILQDTVEDIGFGASLQSTEQTKSSSVSTYKVASLSIEGMTCAACSGAVERALAGVAGVQDAKVNLLASTAQVTFESPASAESLCEVVEDIGFGASLVSLQNEAHPTMKASTSSVATFQKSLPNQMAACLVIFAFPDAAKLRAAHAQLTERSGIAGIVIRERNREMRVSYWSEQVGARDLLTELKPHGGTFGGDCRLGSDDHLLRNERALLMRYLMSVPPTVAVFSIAMVIPNVFGDSPLREALDSEVCCNGALSWKTLLLLTLSAPVVFGVAFPLHRSALRALRSGHLSMDVLVSLGTTLAFMYSLVVTLVWIIVGLEMPSALSASDHQGHHKSSVAPPPHFFEASAMLLSILMLGKVIESHAKRKTGDSLRELASHWPTEARLGATANEEARRVPCDLLQINDVVAITVGEMLPCDGVVQSGDMAVDESVLTGEDMPVRKQKGDLVVGGSKCLEGSAHFVAKAVGSNTAMSQIARMVETAQAAKPDIERIASKVSAVFVPVILGLSLLTFCVWALLVFVEAVVVPTSLNPQTGAHKSEARMAEESFFISRFALALMMMACPCAFGLAAPTAVLVATGAAARRGCLIKSGQALEVANTLKAIVLDKTGTVTVGAPTVTHVALCKTHPRLSQPQDTKLKEGIDIDKKLVQWLPAQGEVTSKEASSEPPSIAQAALLWAAVGAVESESQHPLAKSIHAHASSLLEQVPDVTEWQNTTGLGVEGRVAGLGWVRVGRLAWALTGKAPLRKCECPGKCGCTEQNGCGCECWREAEDMLDAKENSALLKKPPRDAGCACPNLCSCPATGGCGCSCFQLKLEQAFMDKDPVETWIENQGNQGAGVVAVTLDDQLLGAIVMRDVLQPGAAAAVKALQARGVDIWLCSGDQKSTTRAVAAELGIKNWIGEAMPQDKAAHVAALAKVAPVGFVGDGVNDAIALGAATLGVAIGAGAHVTVDAADVVLVRSAFEDFLGFVQLSQMALRTIKMNYVWAFGFNIIGLPLAAGLLYPTVHLPPVVAGAAMACSSLMVVMNSLRLRTSGNVWSRQVSSGKRTPSLQPKAPPAQNIGQPASMSSSGTDQGPQLPQTSPTLQHPGAERWAGPPTE